MLSRGGQMFTISTVPLQLLQSYEASYVGLLRKCASVGRRFHLNETRCLCAFLTFITSMILQANPDILSCFHRIGTVLGFVVSYRTTSSFERYNEGRRLWSQIVLGSRTLARTIWFHVPGESIVSLLTYCLLTGDATVGRNHGWSWR